MSAFERTYRIVSYHCENSSNTGASVNFPHFRLIRVRVLAMLQAVISLFLCDSRVSCYVDVLCNANHVKYLFTVNSFGVK